MANMSKKKAQEEIARINKKISLYVTSMVIMLLLTLTMGLSYAAFQIDVTQELANEVTVGCFNIEFEDSGTSNTYTNISLTNSYPLTTQKALTKTPYTFKVTNTCDYIARANIAINVLKTSSVSSVATQQGKEIGDMIVASIKEGSNAASEPVPLSSLEEGTIRSGDTETDVSYILRTEYLEKNDPKTYSLWMWVPEEINGVEVGNESQGLTLYSKVDIYTQALSGSDIKSAPELYQGLVPVIFDSNGDTIVANLNDKWYDYNNHEWANAVLVTSSARSKRAGEKLNDDDILQYYVWIPRYRYQLFSDNDSTPTQMINIEFEDKYTQKSNGTNKGEWLTHPAFTFGDTELNGLWVGKFETTGGESISSDPTKLTILPNEKSYNNINTSKMFEVLRKMDIEYASDYGLNTNKIDIHMMKNMEWGAVTYLTNSKYGRYINSSSCVSGGCEVWLNPYFVNYSSKTGCAANSVSYTGSANYSVCNEWNTTKGVHASTTDNQYGIYDMSGACWDTVMGNVSRNSSYTFNRDQSGFTSQPLLKYMDTYVNPDASNNAFNNGMIGDATKEILTSYHDGNNGWHDDYVRFPTSSWFYRGGAYYRFIGDSGIFSFADNSGTFSPDWSFRSVLTKQDGFYNGNGLS